MVEIITINQADNKEVVGDVLIEDTRTAKQYEQFGFKHIPEKDAKGILTYVGNGRGNGVIIAGNYPDASPEGDQGETVIFSVNNGNIQAKIKLDSSGNAIFNDGAKSAVSFQDLQREINNLRASIEASIAGAIIGHTHVETGSTTAPGVGTAPPVVVDISSAEVSEVKLP